MMVELENIERAVQDAQRAVVALGENKLNTEQRTELNIFDVMVSNLSNEFRTLKGCLDD